jgi:GNAT superfamily N-acetyltransferase
MIWSSSLNSATTPFLATDHIQKFVIRQVDGYNRDNQALIRWMDAEVFPDQFPVTFTGTTWFIAYTADDEPAGYAAWRPHYPMKTVNELHLTEEYGFLYRAGVLHEFRGHGVQKMLIEAREQDIVSKGINTAISYTDPKSAASMRSLMSAGYKPFVPTPEMNAAGVGRGAGFVHWKKDLV